MVDVSTAPGASSGVLAESSQVACTTERANIEQVIETFTLLKGTPPAAEADLVPDYLREESTWFDLGPNGTVIPAPGSPCT